MFNYFKILKTGINEYSTTTQTRRIQGLTSFISLKNSD